MRRRLLLVALAAAVGTGVLAALLLGQVLYVILYNPISGETHELFRFVPASLGSFCAAGGFYGLGMRLLARRVDSEEASPPQLLQPNI